MMTASALPESCSSSLIPPPNATAYPCPLSPDEDESLRDGYEVIAEGINGLGNEYWSLRGAHGELAYFYRNHDGSYYYKSPCGTGYYLAADGSQQYTTPDGKRYILWEDGNGHVYEDERPLKHHVISVDIQAKL